MLARDAVLNPPGRLEWTVPLGAEGPAALAVAVAAAEAAAAAGGGRRRVPRFFIRISDGVSTNYSEPFDIRLPYTYSAGEGSAALCSSPAMCDAITRQLHAAPRTMRGAAVPCADLSMHACAPHCRMHVQAPGAAATAWRRHRVSGAL